MLKVKSTVRPRNLFIAAACINVAIEKEIENDILITSGMDGKHGKNSLHPKGDALDVRSKSFLDYEDKIGYVQAVLKRLGKGYQGLLEDEGKVNEHFHFEYDPS